MPHVPKYKIADVAVMSFEDALAAAQEPNENYDVNQWLYVPNVYDEYRYILGKLGENPTICIGANPSTARPPFYGEHEETKDALDPTLRSANRFCAAKGRSFLMLNVSAQRATKPGDMDLEANEYLHQQNLKAFKYLLGITKEVWCAWGNLLETRPYLKRYLRDIVDVGNAEGAIWLQSSNFLKSGNPHHPLYLNKKYDLVPYDPETGSLSGL